MKGTVAVLAASACLASCVVNQPGQQQAPQQAGTQPVAMATAFDPAEAKAMLKKGTSTVKGMASVRLADDSTLTCATMQVSLIPATAYAIERMRILYDSIYSGYLPAIDPGNPRSIPATTDPQYLETARSVACDAKGNFTFNDVGEGSFYVTTSIVKRVGEGLQGGTLMRRVDIEGKKLTVQVVLTPP